jgi:hypothetical protein
MLLTKEEEYRTAPSLSSRVIAEPHTTDRTTQWRTQEFCSGGGGGVQQIQLRTEDRENGDLGAVAP